MKYLLLFIVNYIYFSSFVFAEALDETRTYANVSAVFNKHEGEFYSVYNKALRDNPTLEGKTAFEIAITQEGKVVGCNIIIMKSTLLDKNLINQICGVISRLSFGKVRNPDTLIVTYPIEFSPP